LNQKCPGGQEYRTRGLSDFSAEQRDAIDEFGKMMVLADVFFGDCSRQSLSPKA
jgi:hypothetical protein